MIALMASVAYVHYGARTAQLVTLNLPTPSALALFVNVLMLLGIIFTYPLQIFPVVGVLEEALFGKGILA